MNGEKKIRESPGEQTKFDLELESWWDLNLYNLNVLCEE